MSWTYIGQSFDAILSAILAFRLIGIQLQWKYIALLVFILFDGAESLLYLPFKFYHPFDYRIFYVCASLVTWCTTISMVYALMIAIMQHLPGIKRFCVWFLNVVFVGWIGVSLFLVRPEWARLSSKLYFSFLARAILVSQILDRAFSLAEILVILSTLIFVLRFPVRVSKNLAAFSVGIAIYLFSRVTLFLLLTYVPESKNWSILQSVLPVTIAFCLLYWLFTITAVGEETEVTLGRSWQAIPDEHLVRQLQELNTALLSSRD